MDRNLPDIEELFKSALEDEEEMPEPKVWKAIDNILDKDNVTSIKKKYDNLKKAAFLLFFMFIGLSIYEFEKPSGSRNNNILKREIVSEKNSGANSKNESNGIANKSAGSSGLNKNKSKRFTDNSLVLKDRARTYKSTIFNSKLLHQQPIIAKSWEAIVKNKIRKIQQKKFVEEDRKSSEKPVSTDYITLYAKRLNIIKLNSLNTITLPRSPVLIKVISRSENKTSMKESVKIKNRKASPFSINLFFSPDFASYRTENDGTGNNNDEATNIVKHERHQFSTTAGVFVDYKLKKHWRLQSGLTFSNINISESPTTIYAQNDNLGDVKYRLNTSSGYGYILPSFSNNPVVGDSLYAFSSIHTLDYIGIPAAVKYAFTKGKLTLTATLGAAVNILTRAKIETEIEKGFSNETEIVNNLQGIKKWYLSGFAGVGLDYNIGKKIALTFEPAYRFAANSINKNTPVKSYPNSIGLATGVRINF